MFFSFAYLTVRALLGLLVRSRRGPDVARSMSCAARLPDRQSARLIARSLPPRRVTCRVRRDHCGSSRLERYCVGTTRSSGGSGARKAVDRAVRSSRPRSSSSCFGSRARTRAGGTGGYAGSWSSSGFRHHRQVSVGCLLVPICIRRRDAQARAGESLCTSRRRASSRATSLRSRPYSCAASTCSSSSSTAAAEFSLAAVPPARTAARRAASASRSPNVARSSASN